MIDAASIAVPRWHRRAKTDKIDSEGLLRVLLAYKRGQPRVLAMVAAPSPDEEDSRRIGRQCQVLIAERIWHVTRIKGLLLSQGISDCAPLRRDRRARLAALRTGDGREPPAQIGRELDWLKLLLEQIAAVEPSAMPCSPPPSGPAARTGRTRWRCCWS